MVWQISAVTDNVKQYRSDYKNELSYSVTKLYTTNNWFGRGLFSAYSFYLRLHAVVDDILVWATQDSNLSRVDDWALLYDFGSIYRSLDMYQHAGSLYSFCLYEILKTKSIFHPSSLAVKGDLALMNLAQGDKGLALSDYEWLLQARTRVLGRNHVATAGAMLGVGRILKSQAPRGPSIKEGSYERALELLHEALIIQESLVGAEDVLTRNVFDEMIDLPCGLYRIPYISDAKNDWISRWVDLYLKMPQQQDCGDEAKTQELYKRAAQVRHEALIILEHPGEHEHVRRIMDDFQIFFPCRKASTTPLDEKALRSKYSELVAVVLEWQKRDLDHKMKTLGRDSYESQQASVSLAKNYACSYQVDSAKAVLEQISPQHLPQSLRDDYVLTLNTIGYRSQDTEKSFEYYSLAIKMSKDFSVVDSWALSKYQHLCNYFLEMANPEEHWTFLMISSFSNTPWISLTLPMRLNWISSYLFSRTLRHGN
jgi:hypothetical protein